ncbi:hypothetical protein F5Y10DRAFT_260237 [Nemania abortiva]|nr:hypothetical protein F5Y10DRAFT_260237 [Nemania abortiva]
MAGNNGRRGGNRGRKYNDRDRRNDDRRKRRRSPTSDDFYDDRREHGTHKKNRPDPDALSRGQRQQLAAVRHGADVVARIDAGPGVQTPQVLQNVSVQVATPSEVRNAVHGAHPHSRWVVGQIKGNLGERLPPRHVRERMLQEEDQRAQRKLLGATRGFGTTRIPPLGTSGVSCAICKSNTHEAPDCRKLNAMESKDPKHANLSEREKAFKRWCPRHKTDSHTMDECKQKWDWLRNEEEVVKYLLEYCRCGPAFATNLIDWRCLVEDELQIVLPWTPEYSLLTWQEDPEFHENKYRMQDPATSSPEARGPLGYQTSNGQAPQFMAYAQLKNHAEQEYQKFQLKMEGNRANAADDNLFLQDLHAKTARLRRQLEDLRQQVQTTTANARDELRQNLQAAAYNEGARRMGDALPAAPAPFDIAGRVRTVTATLGQAQPATDEAAAAATPRYNLVFPQHPSSEGSDEFITMEAMRLWREYPWAQVVVVISDTTIIDEVHQDDATQAEALNMA